MPSIRIDYLEEDCFQSAQAEAFLSQSFTAEILSRAKINEHPAAMIASGAILSYVNQTQKINPQHISEIKWYSTENFLLLDDTARRNLEIFSTIQDNSKAGSLFSLFHETLTPMGTRRLRWWMNYPLVNAEKSKQDWPRLPK